MAVPLPRSRDHRPLKEAEAPFEDEKFCYLIAARNAPAQAAGARVLAPPLARKHGAGLKLCVKTGISETSILKRDKAEYQRIRRTVWGDRIVAPAKETQ